MFEEVDDDDEDNDTDDKVKDDKKKQQFKKIVPDNEEEEKEIVEGKQRFFRYTGNVLPIHWQRFATTPAAFCRCGSVLPLHHTIYLTFLFFVFCFIL